MKLLYNEYLLCKGTCKTMKQAKYTNDHFCVIDDKRWINIIYKAPLLLELVPLYLGSRRLYYSLQGYMYIYCHTSRIRLKCGFGCVMINYLENICNNEILYVYNFNIEQLKSSSLKCIPVIQSNPVV